MRIPLTPVVDSRDGLSDKDARLTNVLGERDMDTELACVRPALVAVSANTGNGNSVVDFNGTLVTVFGAVLGTGTTPTSVGAVVDGFYDSTQSPI